MAATTIRISEVAGRNLDKTIVAANTKPTALPLPIPPLASEGVARERAPGYDTSLQDSRSGSPDRSKAGRDCLLREEETSAFGRAGIQVTEQEGVSNADSQEPNVQAVNVTLESCPSFAEQRSKPLWLERHQTLQRAYLSFVVKSSVDEAAVEKQDNEHHGDKSLTPFLPGWDISRSKVWLMVESALLQLEAANAQPATSHSHAQALSHQPAGPQVASSGGTDESAGHASPRHHLLHHIHQLHTQHHQHQRQQQPWDLKQHEHQHDQQHQRQEPHVLRSCSLARTCPPIPRGFGPLMLSLTPSMTASMFSRKRMMQPGPQQSGISPISAELADDEVKAASLPSATASMDQDEAQEEGFCPRRHCVAFAAGLAAATSAAAAVSSAAAVATAGLAATASAVPGTASSLLHVGKVINAGGNVLADKIQNLATKHAAEAVAHVVLGEEAPASMRVQLVTRVQATVAGASILWFLFNLATMSDTLAHLDFEHDFSTSAKVVLDLVTTGPGFMENCRELLQIGVAVGLGVAERTSSVTEAVRL